MQGTPRVKLHLGPIKLGICCDSPLVIPAGLEGYLTRDPPDAWITIEPGAVFARYPKSVKWDALPPRRVSELTGLTPLEERPENLTHGKDYNLVLQASTLVDHVVRLMGANGILVHALGCRNPAGEGFLFCGPSGIGKTTLARNFEAIGFETISDDRMMSWKQDPHGFRISCYPWQGRTEFTSVSRADLRAIFFLDLEGPRLHRLQSYGMFVQSMLGCVFRHTRSARVTQNQLACLEELFRSVPAFRSNRNLIGDCEALLKDAQIG